MSAVPAGIPGRPLGSPRNGLPAPRGYVYRGSGTDILTPAGEMRAWWQQIGARPHSVRLTAADRAAAERAEASAALGRLIPPPPPAAPGSRHVTCGSDRGYRRHARLREPACRPCKDAHALYLRQYKMQRYGILVLPAYPGPGRCGDCGYKRDSIGHKVTCGGAR